jgi:aryl-alcohol dehydrogenase-like predicted oxidoreductase
MSSSTESAKPVLASGTFHIGGELPVHRLGFGAMRITGEGIWGDPRDPQQSREVLREAVRLGVDFIDTAESYGPGVSETLIAEALHPYPDELVIATKGGFNRTGPGKWHVDCRPERLRDACESSLRRLRLDCIDLWQLHRIDRNVPVEEQFGVISELRDEGKIRFVGVSEVSVEQLARARELIDVVSVQNRFNYAERNAEDVLKACEDADIGFIPWFPLAVGDLAGEGSALAAAAERHGVKPSQLALAWLLHRSPVMLPIPGTGSIEHLRENCAAALVELTENDLKEL